MADYPKYYVMANGKRISPAMYRAEADVKAEDESRGYQRVDVIAADGGPPVTSYEYGILIRMVRAPKQK